ncbi:WD repeat-containing and planar cell polarity effector protein fritz [Papilio machaon]|uniref:WD repeat-containing and planar cell polarity effector protein fritz n=1 Tax=Papilio machaon TaxID=76193 RepID=A0A194R2W3_PAPMA|nr:WD repeat-containing and planar cell polarity effector protein fritz [Papilio machaon]
MFSYNVKFITSEETLYLKSGDFKSYKYETKKRLDETVYDAGKRNYCERRGGYWRIPKSSQLRQLESTLRDRHVVECIWVNDLLATLVFSSGVIAYTSIKPKTLDVTQILFDRYCVGKLSGQTVTGVIFSKTHLLFTHAERTATLFTFGKSIENSSHPCRLSDRDPHVQVLELGGARRAERRVSWCCDGSGIKVLLWSAASAEPAPWSPVLEDLANLHLYQIHGQQVTLIAFHQLENEVLCAELSQKNDNVVHIVEQTACHKNGVTLEWQQYDISNPEERVVHLSALRVCARRVSLPAVVRVARRSHCGHRLLATCIDGSLHIIHQATGLTHSVRAGFIPTDVRWAGELVLAVEEAGRLQCFDRALSLLHHHTKCLDLVSHFRDTRRMQVLATRDMKCGPIILALFAGGPLTLLQITHPRLLTAWIRADRTSNAVSLLRAMDWEEEGVECLRALSELVHGALRNSQQDKIVNNENAAQAALGAFLAPSVPLGTSALRFAPPVHDLARKFFHHLLRRGRIEKALSLAVDLSAWDLFADARWAATRAGVQHLAREAARAAHHYAQLHADGNTDILQLTADTAHAWIRADRTSNAVSLLRAMDWEEEGVECLRALSDLVHGALRNSQQDKIVNNENAAQAALGAFLAPSVPLGTSALRFAPPVHDLARKFFHHLLRRGRIEKALSLAVDLSAWDLFADARWAATRAGVQHLAREAARAAHHYAQLHDDDSECSESCSQCSSRTCSESEEELNGYTRNGKTTPPPLPRLPQPPQPSQPSQPTILPVPITQNEPTSTHSIRPNLHQYLERDNTIWNTELRDDTCIDRKMYEEHFKPIKNLQTVKWQSVDNMLMNYRKPLSNSNTDVQRSHLFDVIPRVQDDKVSHFKHVYQTDLREAIPTTYRYQSNITTNTNGRLYRHDSTWSGKSLEKNKVKFSDTVTVAVVSEPPSSPDTTNELADSLPLCAPHKYLANFAPAPTVPKAPTKPPTAHKLTISKVPTIAKVTTSPSPAQSPAGTTLDYVEV